MTESKKSNSKTKTSKNSTKVKDVEVSTPKKDNTTSFGNKITWIFNSWKEIWKAFVLNIDTLVMVWLVPIIIYIVSLIAGMSVFVTSVLTGSYSTINILAAMISLLFVFASIFVTIVFLPAHVIVQLESVKGNKIGFKTAWEKSVQFILRYIGIYILIGVIAVLPIIISFLLIFVLIGFILLPISFVFAVLVLFATMLVPYILIDKNLSISEAIKEGFAVAKENWQWLLALIIVQLVINLAANIIASATVIGSTLAWLISIVATYIIAYVYVKQIAKN